MLAAETSRPVRRLSPANGFRRLAVIALGLCAADPAQAGEMQVDASAVSVSVTARDAPLEELLGEIARQAKLVLVIDTPLPGTANQNFRDLSMAVAIRRILGPRGFVLEYVAEPGSGPRPCRLLVLADGPGASAEVRSSASADDARTRLAAISALADEGGEEATRALAAAALNDAEPAVRREAVHALGEVAGEAGIATLEQALMDADRGVRETAAAAFSDIGGERSAQALGAVLNDADPSLRVDAVDALGDIGGPAAAALLRRALEDVDPVVRAAAADYLAEQPEN